MSHRVPDGCCEGGSCCDSQPVELTANPRLDVARNAGCGCGGAECGDSSSAAIDGQTLGFGNCAPGLSRRDFIRTVTAGAAAASLGMSLTGRALGDTTTRIAPHHLIPTEKNLPAAWLKLLFERGTKETWSGEELRYIGMPVGGIGTGQLYLRGDGNLGMWEIFNAHFPRVWDPKMYLNPFEPPRPFPQGFGVVLEGDSGSRCRILDAENYPRVRFNGQHPIAEVTYSDNAYPVEVRLEAFSPFVPLDEKASALPATILNYTVTNTSHRPRRVSMLAWMANPVAHRQDLGEHQGRRRSRIRRGEEGTLLLHRAVETPREAAKATRAPIILADFEAGDYGDWVAQGEAFSEAPAKGTFAGQSLVQGFEGKGLANSFRQGDGPHGTLTSPPFKIERRYLNFLIGGGSHDGTAAKLLVDGEPVRSSSGKNDERLTWMNWDLADLQGREGVIQLVDEVSGGWGHINADQFELSDAPRTGQGAVAFDARPDVGTLALASAIACREPEAARETLYAVVGLPPGMEFAERQDRDLGEEYRSALLTESFELQPGESRTFPFIVAWHFPNYEPGPEYATRFRGAAGVARHVLKNREKYTELTRRWRDTWYDSTLPYWLLDRIHSTVTTLATGTCQWWRDGRFYAWEGVRCCHGTCTHVWNYAHSVAWLFPGLERSAREMQDYGAGYHPESGLVGFRGDGNYAADGQCGTILKTWREHRMSPDDNFLRRNWPRVKEALRYSIRQDENGDGLIEKTQHNTYDINFEGPNTFVGSLYLAALRAGEEMAHELGDEEFVREVRPIYESGREKTQDLLWDGEYYTQEVDLEKYPRHQYGPGCLADQTFGQTWAHLVGLGYIYPARRVRRALESIWKYNWAPDVEAYQKAHPELRPFAEPGEAGLFICTWPKSAFLNEGVMYRNENWTGIEYQVATGMIAEGLITEALAICRAVHERYHPSKRNPYNEIECGDHYARGMASWGVLLALAGYEYHGPKRRLRFAPRITPEDFRCAFTTAEGWGTYSQKRSEGSQACRLVLKYGTLKLSELRLSAPKGLSLKSARLGDVDCARESKVETSKGAPEADAEHRIMLSPVRMEESDVLEVIFA